MYFEDESYYNNEKNYNLMFNSSQVAKSRKLSLWAMESLGQSVTSNFGIYAVQSWLQPQLTQDILGVTYITVP